MPWEDYITSDFQGNLVCKLPDPLFFHNIRVIGRIWSLLECQCGSGVEMNSSALTKMSVEKKTLGIKKKKNTNSRKICHFHCHCNTFLKAPLFYYFLRSGKRSPLNTIIIINVLVILSSEFFPPNRLVNIKGIVAYKKKYADNMYRYMGNIFRSLPEHIINTLNPFPPAVLIYVAAGAVGFSVKPLHICIYGEWLSVLRVLSLIISNGHRQIPIMVYN